MKRPSGSPFDRAVIAMDRGDFEFAIQKFSEAVEMQDRAALSLSKRGVCRLRAGDRIGAARDFGSALDRDPRCVSALVNIGNLALEANMLDEARARYEAALRIDDRSAHAHHNLGIVYRRQGKLAQSIQELRLAATLEAHPRAIVERFKRLWRNRGR